MQFTYKKKERQYKISKEKPFYTLNPEMRKKRRHKKPYNKFVAFFPVPQIKGVFTFENQKKVLKTF